MYKSFFLHKNEKNKKKENLFSGASRKIPDKWFIRGKNSVDTSTKGFDQSHQVLFDRNQLPLSADCKNIHGSSMSIFMP